MSAGRLRNDKPANNSNGNKQNIQSPGDTIANFSAIHTPENKNPWDSPGSNPVLAAHPKQDRRISLGWGATQVKSRVHGTDLIWRARVPRMRARSYLVMNLVVIRCLLAPTSRSWAMSSASRNSCLGAGEAPLARPGSMSSSTRPTKSLTCAERVVEKDNAAYDRGGEISHSRLCGERVDDSPLVVSLVCGNNQTSSPTGQRVADSRQNIQHN